MAKRKARKNDKNREPLFNDISPHAKQSIGALAMGSLGVFFLLSLFNYAGMVGDWTKLTLTYLFGGGAWLAPILCGFFVYAFLKPREDSQKISTSKISGIIFMFLSALTLLEIYKVGAGGKLGWLIEAPLSYLIKDVATSVFALAFFGTGIFLTFNTGLKMPTFLRKRELNKEADDTIDDEDFDIPLEAEEEQEAEEETDDEEKPAEKSGKKSVTERLGLTKSGSDDFVVSNFVGTYDAPPLSLLGKDRGKAKTGDIKANANTIKRVLKEFGINVEMDTVEIGPTVARYALKPAQGVKISRIVGLQRELELNLASGTIRIEAPIHGKSLVGIEVPNVEKANIGLASLLSSPEYTDSPKPLFVALGKDITGHVHFANIARMPHALIAGTTGSGKSVAIHNVIISLLFRNSPEQLRFIMIDPKRVELTLYDGIPHLLSPVIIDAKKALMSLKWAVKEMERRYDILQAEKVQNLDSYHSKIYQPAKAAWEKNGEQEEEKQNLPEPLPYIVIVMDELADLMHSYPRELEALIVRLAQMSRAVGIHLILATQRPSVNVITDTIKANIPTRIALQVISQIDSRTILDQPGAEKLLGKGDMLFLSGESSKPTRLQSAFISEDEIKNVVNYLKKQADAHELDWIDLEPGAGAGDNSIFGTSVDDDDDDLYEDAKQAVKEAGKASTSYLQRKLRIGYSRAARLIDMLEERGVIGPQNGSKGREILDEAPDDDEYGDTEDDNESNEDYDETEDNELNYR